MKTLEKAVADRPDHRLHAFVISLNPTGADLEKLATQAGVQNVGVAYANADQADEYKINATAHNTVMLYSHKKVSTLLVNMPVDEKSLAQLQQQLLALP